MDKLYERIIETQKENIDILLDQIAILNSTITSQKLLIENLKKKGQSYDTHNLESSKYAN